MRAIDRKLFRDLWRVRSQALAIGLVVAAGLAAHIMLQSAYASLELTQATYYERYRFADVFVSLTRAPASLAREVAGIPGVAAVQTRVVVDVTLQLPSRTEPVSGRLISVDEDAPPAVNAFYLAEGRALTPGHESEVLVSRAFARLNGLEPGDTFAAIINGRRRTLTIVGLALSPEYIYAIRPGELIADDARFGIVWMNREALASAYQMEGGFNDLSVRLRRDASERDVIARIDRLVEPYGGLGAIPRALQLSHFFLQGEIDQLLNMGRILPAVFLAVAAFLMNVVLTRLVAVEREQIAALKALGYSNGEVGWHYQKWGLSVALAGAVVGTAVGAWMGRGMMGLYADFFQFPVLEYRLPAAVVAQAVGVAAIAAVAGAFGAVRHVVRLPPAEAMRPAAPARYRVSWIERLGFGRLLSQPGRMVVRNLERRPGRAAMSLVAIAVSGALLVVGLFSLDSVDLLIERQFFVAQRWDAMVTFFTPVSSSALYDLERLPGVRRAEGFRSVPVRMRSGPRYRYVSLQGAAGESSLDRAVDGEGRVVPIPPEGLVLSRKLGELLGVGVGDTVRVEVLTESRPVRDVPVSRLVDDYLGLNAYMDPAALHAMLGEGRSLSGAYLTVDPRHLEDLYARLRATPAVAGVQRRAAMLQSFQDTLAESVNISRTFTVLFAAIIAFGVVYNTVRVALSERGRELATLRVIGLTRAEIARVLFGEWTLLVALALPLGMVAGYGLAAAMVRAFDTEVYRLPLVVGVRTYAWAVTTILVAAAGSALIVRRRLNHLDLIAVLKTRE